jgi:hypothetical protein
VRLRPLSTSAAAVAIKQRKSSRPAATADHRADHRARPPPQKCAWGCETGYYPLGGTCAACAALPAGAGWDTAAGARECAYRCLAGLYGHPGYWGICVPCSTLMGSVARPAPALPANAAWRDDLGRCDVDTWSCAAGFGLRVLPGGVAVCCPLAPVAHAGSNSNAPRGLCGVACDSGYYWAAGAWACAPCPGPPPPAGQAWGDNCTQIFDCSLYAVQAGIALPQHSYWPPAPAGPAQCVWTCNAGYDRAGEGFLCCSTAVAGYGVAGRDWGPSGCTQQCKPGLFSASADDPCVPCAQYLRENFGIDFCQRYREGVILRVEGIS